MSSSLTIGVLMGGASRERDISLISGRAVHAALAAQGVRVRALDISSDPAECAHMLGKAGLDVAFIALHGVFGEDGTIQTICEDLGLAYTGSGPEASQLAFNKVRSHRMFVAANLPVPPHIVVEHPTGSDTTAYCASLDRELRVRLPKLGTCPAGYVIKPATEGSSIGIMMVDDIRQVVEAVCAAFAYGSQVIIEKKISGREITVGLTHNEPLPVVEIIPNEDFFDFDAKYTKGKTTYKVPADLLPDEVSAAQELAWQAHQLLGCYDFSRVDMLVDEHGELFILEVNTIPGFTSTSLLPMAARAAGVSFEKLCMARVNQARMREE